MKIDFGDLSLNPPVLSKPNIIHDQQLALFIASDQDMHGDIDLESIYLDIPITTSVSDAHLTATLTEANVNRG